MATSNVFTKAKSYQRKHPRLSWQECIQRVSGKKKKRRVGAVKKKKQTGRSHKGYDSLLKAKRPGKRKSASGNTYYEYRKNRTDARGSLTGVSSATLKGALAERLKKSLGEQLVRKELATTKTAKKKIQKSVVTTRKALRKLL